MSSHPRNPSKWAIVIGASVAGLLAARVLADHFERVVLIERDRLEDGPAPRKGTPQVLHAHGLLARGREVIEQLLPGFTEALQAQGAVVGDIAHDVAFGVARRRFARTHCGHLGVFASRPLIEAELRRRVLAIANVYLLAEVDVIAPEWNAAGDAVCGVRARSRTDGSAAPSLRADLVVDCSGRASHSPRWLAERGFAPPAEERVPVDLQYLSAYFRRDPASGIHVHGAISAASSAQPRGGVILAQEPDALGRARWVLTLGGYAGDHPQPTLKGLRDRAREIGMAEMVALAEHGEMIGGLLHYRHRHSVRRHYEKLERFPAGYLVMGDAIASFTPSYGQGMTVAACEALALRDALADADGQALLHRRFFGAASRIVDTPWQLSVGGDLALPMVPGPRPLASRAVNAWVAAVQRAAADDPQVAIAFMKVMHMLDAPASLFAPGLVWRVVRSAAARIFGGRPQASENTAVNAVVPPSPTMARDADRAEPIAINSIAASACRASSEG